jgi:hypothetical protein
MLEKQAPLARRASLRILKLFQDASAIASMNVSTVAGSEKMRREQDVLRHNFEEDLFALSEQEETPYFEELRRGVSSSLTSRRVEYVHLVASQLLVTPG